MDTLSQLVKLSEIGILDGKLRGLKEKESALPSKANAATKRAEELSLRLKGIEAKHSQVLIDRRKLDVDLQNERNNLRKWEARADQIRGDREYTALMSEIGTLKRAIANIESKIIDDMQALEDLEKEITQVKAKAELATKEAETEMAAVKSQLEELASKIGQLQASKEAILNALPATIVRRYKMIADRRAGIGVAILANEVCQACSRTVPPELFNRVVRAEVIEQCPNCNRILVTDAFSHVEHQTE